ncbi:ribbon-helix-helix protein, copG family [mine drainage metagenome]|uniref:Ribbon-helix-helix protein, copG family n=1 Tax=mine drainage metagenome TaxID=410659 RepID=A0A1J5QZN5_9ZZZZ
MGRLAGSNALLLGLDARLGMLFRTRAVRAGGEEGIPEPTRLEDLASDPDYSGGAWTLFDIDLSRINARAERLNISLPERLVQRIDTEARRRKLSRSAFLALAAEHEMSTA